MSILLVDVCGIAGMMTWMANGLFKILPSGVLGVVGSLLGVVLYGLLDGKKKGFLVGTILSFLGLAYSLYGLIEYYYDIDFFS